MSLFVFAEGRLLLGVNKLSGFYAFDGINVLKPYTLCLIHKILRHKNKITISVYGKWLIINNVIVWFKINKKVIAYVNYEPKKLSIEEIVSLRLKRNDE